MALVPMIVQLQQKSGFAMAPGFGAHSPDAESTAATS